MIGSTWVETESAEEECPVCHRHDLLSRRNDMPLLQSSDPLAYTEWRCRDPECFELFGTWING